MNIVKDGKVLNVTEKVYNTIYKTQGYVPYNSKNVGKKEVKIDDMTKAEIVENLEKDGIEHNSSDLKQDLFNLLGSD